MSFSDKQRQILSFPYSDYSALICDGAIRSGKTSVMSLSFILWAMGNFNGQSFGVCGKTVVSAERNIIKPLMTVTYLKQEFKIKFANHILTVSRGKRTNTFYIFGGRDESSYQLIQGITLAGVLLDEVALMPRSFVEQALARCSVAGSKFWFNCNPEGPLHWFYTEWVQKATERNALHLHFTLDDNPSLPDSIKERYKAMYSGVFYDRYIRGLWVVAEGRVYDQFSEDLHVVKDYTPEKYRGEYYISVDYGTLNPFSAGLWHIQDGRAVRIAEYYYSGRSTAHSLTDEEYYTKIEELAGARYISSVIVDPSAASFIECIRRHGRFSVRKAKNDVLPGIRTTAAMLRAGVIKIGAECKDAIREFGLYRWDEKATSDKVLKKNDHAMDDIRYFCATIMRRDRDARVLLRGALPDEED